MKEYTVKVFEDGSKSWYLDGERHREDGPAVERADGLKQWWLNGELHREDGPAIEGADGTKYWYLHSEQVTEEEHKRRTSGITMDDARLIAAAPELLEALEKMVGLFEPGRVYDFKEVSALTYEALSIAIPAIAKAKGESHE